MSFGTHWHDNRKAIEHREDLYTYLGLSEVLLGSMFPIGLLGQNSPIISSLSFASTLISLPFEFLSAEQIGEPSTFALAEDFKLDPHNYPNLYANATIIHISQESAEEVLSYVSRLNSFTKHSVKRSSLILRSLQAGIIVINFLI